MYSKITQNLKKNPWYEGSFELFEYENFPKECPWTKFLEHNKSEFIQKMFQPLASLLPNTFELLIANCEDIYALSADHQWVLIYVIDEDNFLSGGEPKVSPSLSPDVIADGWELPEELKTFYAVHNGFGYLWSLGMLWSSHGVVPDYKLETLNPLFISLREHESDIELDYDPKSLLQFYPDGTGNEQCFYYLPNGELTTVDWDHETREISHGQDFWNFVDERLSKLI